MTDNNESNGNEAQAESFDGLLENHSDLVYNVAVRIMGNHEDAEDVVQEAFLSAYRAYDRFRGQSRASTWLYRITVNAALMRLRKTKLARTLTRTGIEEMAIADWTTTPDKGAANAELRDKLQSAFAQLDPDMRATVALRDVQGFSSSEAAEMLEVTVPALKSRLHRARVLLREYLSDYLAAPTT